MPEEYLDVVDENNQLTGELVSRVEAHTKGLWHRTVHIYFYRVRNGAIDFLVHLRAKTKDRSPNKLDTRFGGHLKSGESVSESVRNEIREEIGLVLEVKDLLAGPVRKRNNFPNNEFTYVFYYPFNGEVGDLYFADGEIQSIRWMRVNEIEASMQKEPEQWAASLSGLREMVADLRARI